MICKLPFTICLQKKCPKTIDKYEKVCYNKTERKTER